MTAPELITADVCVPVIGYIQVLVPGACSFHSGRGVDTWESACCWIANLTCRWRKSQNIHPKEMESNIVSIIKRCGDTSWIDVRSETEFMIVVDRP